jgi:hypothetical protein
MRYALLAWESARGSMWSLKIGVFPEDLILVGEKVAGKKEQLLGTMEKQELAGETRREDFRKRKESDKARAAESGKKKTSHTTCFTMWFSELPTPAVAANEQRNWTNACYNAHHDAGHLPSSSQLDRSCAGLNLLKPSGRVLEFQEGRAWTGDGLVIGLAKEERQGASC